MTPQPLRQLEVRLSSQRVGLLERTRAGLVRWLPDPIWERGGQRPRLGLDFLRSPGMQEAATGLPPWFENLLPEPGSALRDRLCRTHGLRPTDSLGLLSALGGDLPGAVEVRAVAAQDALPIAAADAAPEIAEPADRTSAEASLDLGPGQLRFSLAGMQLKLSMAALGQKFALPARGHHGSWIVKLPGREMPDLPDVEAATMAWAQAAGHRVPENYTIPADRLVGLPADWTEGCPRAYAIRRFDRQDGTRRVHHEDLCQALGVLPTHKYGDTGSPHFSFDSALRLVLDAAGEAVAQEFARRIGFVIACGNDDSHLKNWSLEWGDKERPSLTPCYDLVSTISWEKYGWTSNRRKGPTLGLGLGRVRYFRQLDRVALIRHSDRVGQPWAREHIMEGIQQARRAWPEIEARCPPAMRLAMRSHWRNVPVLREAGPLAWTEPASPVTSAVTG